MTLWRVLFVSPAVAAMAAAGFAAFTVLGARRLRKAPDSTNRVLRLALGAWMLLVLVATLYPEQPLGSSHEPINWHPGEQFSSPGVDQFELDLLTRQYLGNAAMFVPLGTLGWLLTRRSFLTFICCAGFSAAIESIQQIMAAGRSADIDDLLCNSGGALVGLTLAAVSWLGIGLFERANVDTARIH
ncbi:VanZ family protein [Streptomyces sp. GbtcB6]|uniref:VanZ family protein n=1 Tax=Streptomyces sp. GbtcB6 TaxID=2824751 RepID=UPI001C30E1C7